MSGETFWSGFFTRRISKWDAKTKTANIALLLTIH
jgi:hypothetical protein